MGQINGFFKITLNSHINGLLHVILRDAVQTRKSSSWYLFVGQFHSLLITRFCDLITTEVYCHHEIMRQLSVLHED